MKKLLLHACCADCGLKLIETIKKDFEEITIYFYNPNIHPRSEYLARLKALQLVFKDKFVKLIIPDWQPKDYFKVIKNKTKPIRCEACWKLRLKKTAEFAKKNDFGCFSSTLLSSQYQNSKKIIEIGKKIGEKYNLNFLIPKKINKELKTKGFYKQIYCGCCYSLEERLEEKYLK